jgi:hypothetical protein
MPAAPYSPYSPTVRSRAGFVALASWAAQPAYSQVFATNPKPPSLVPERMIRTHSLRLVGEYGITHNTMISVLMPVVWQQSLGPTEGNTNPQTQSGRLAGLGNTELAVKYRRDLHSHLVSASLRIGLPAQHSRANSGLATGFNTFLLMPMLHIGRPIGLFSYGFVYSGYGLRSRQYGQVLHSGAAFGFKRQHYGLELASTFFYALNGVATQISPAQRALGLYHPQQSYWVMEAKGDWRFSRFVGVNTGISVPIWGRFYPKMPTLEAAVYFQWD